MSGRAVQQERRLGDRRGAHGWLPWGVVAKWGQRAAVAYVILLSAFAIATWQQARDLHAAAWGSCHRLNVQRAETNAANFASWRFFELVVHLTATNRTRQRAKAILFAHQLAGYAEDVKWTPLTWCPSAVDHPLALPAPNPRRFYVNANGSTPLPIRRALHPGPNN